MKLYSVVGVLSQQKVTMSALFFSIAVFFVWSFIPVLAYLLAKLIGAKGRSSARVLIVIGASAALLENALFYYNVLTPYQGDRGTLIVMGIFFITAYFSLAIPRLSAKNENA